MKIHDFREFGQFIKFEEGTGAIVLRRMLPDLNRPAFTDPEFEAALRADHDKTSLDLDEEVRAAKRVEALRLQSDKTFEVQFPHHLAAFSSIPPSDFAGFAVLPLHQYLSLLEIKNSPSLDLEAFIAEDLQVKIDLNAALKSLYLPLVNSNPTTAYPLPTALDYFGSTSNPRNHPDALDDFVFEQNAAMESAPLEAFNEIDPVLTAVELQHVLTKDLSAEEVNRILDDLLPLVGEGEDRARFLREVQRKLTFIYNEVLRFYIHNIFDKKSSDKEKYGMVYVQEGPRDWPETYGNFSLNQLLQGSEKDVYTEFFLPRNLWKRSETLR